MSPTIDNWRWSYFNKRFYIFPAVIPSQYYNSTILNSLKFLNPVQNQFLPTKKVIVIQRDVVKAKPEVASAPVLDETSTTPKLGMKFKIDLLTGP